MRGAECIATRTRVTVTFEDGQRFDLRRVATDPVAKVLEPLRALLRLDRVRIDLTQP